MAGAVRLILELCCIGLHINVGAIVLAWLGNLGMGVSAFHKRMHNLTVGMLGFTRYHS